MTGDDEDGGWGQSSDKKTGDSDTTLTSGEDDESGVLSGESHVVDECQYCGSEDNVEEAYHTMCESCHEAFMSGQKKGREIEQKMTGGEDDDSYTVYYFHRLEDGSLFRCDHVAKRGCCEDCSRAFRAGNLRGEKQTRGVRGREEIQRKIEEIKGVVEDYEDDYDTLEKAPLLVRILHQQGHDYVEALEWVLGEVDDL